MLDRRCDVRSVHGELKHRASSTIVGSHDDETIRIGSRVVASLFVFRGNDQGQRYELTEVVATIGRDRNNTIQLHDTEVSRRHAELRKEGASYSLSDLSSSNGTFVNGQKITSQQLVNGDHVQLGSTQLLFTGAKGDSSSDVAQRIDVVARRIPNDQSRIISSMSQEAGSRILDATFQLPHSLPRSHAASNLQIIYRTALAVSHTLDIDQLLQRILDLIFDWVEADRGCIMLMDTASGHLEPKVKHRRGTTKPRDDRLTMSQTILDYVMQRGEGVLTSDAREDERWDPAASIVGQGVREAICVPMAGRYGTVGVIYIDTLSSPQQLSSRGHKNKFNDDHLKLMIAIAHQAALAVEDTQYYSAMVQAERLAAVGQTIASLSHHIKNILQGIRGGSFLIKEGLAKHDEMMVTRGWNFVEKNQERISTLVMDMLTFSKEREPELTEGDLNQVVSEAVELMASVAQARQVELVWQPSDDVPVLVFDHEGIHRAVVNVITNAIDACAETLDGVDRPGRIRIATAYANGTAAIRVEDNAMGIPPEDLDQIFSLFVSRKGSRGTGLGLPVSEKIMKEHGGRIFVESTVGEGSRFTLELPRMSNDGVRETSSLEMPK